MNKLEEYQEMLDAISNVRLDAMNDPSVTLEQVSGKLERCIEQIYLELKIEEDLIDYSINLMTSQWTKMVNPKYYTKDYTRPAVVSDIEKTCYNNAFIYC
ncbi:MAG: hypothetical protein HOK52_14645 [Candidatus Marinimicrobia bacterium]|jgi:hypothetical protein|nr:hypothetical protein [Candidatus Neomarinimicrobiota bacterium]